LSKSINQQDFESAMQEVLAAKAVMQQSLFADNQSKATEASSARALEPLWRSAVFAALALAATALIVASVAVALALMR
jgi:chromosome condensin MukBEF complex kleisin-like MukF subunit